MSHPESWMAHSDFRYVLTHFVTHLKDVDAIKILTLSTDS